MSDNLSSKNRQRGRGKIKITKRQLVNNEELVSELAKFKESYVNELTIHNKKIQDAIKSKQPEQVIEKLQKQEIFGTPSERLGEIFVNLVDNYATKSNFSGYTYLEEMKSRAIFFLLKYSKNFDYTKSKNAFAYCTQFVYHAFLQVIKKEKKHIETKKALVEKYYHERKFDKRDSDSLFGNTD
jgi:hypothetical protein